ncbi:hypothetical protein PR003_g9311 [Phytophthora rubi]|uniref:FYVE-type domain-containing protein n=1 Tax=Phytophthora rubi TaxID=129364 RepID=A0A6A4FSN3_9STRA|nr:hypothetical protein PR002_g9197 [Phytophthora rubi]KAE9035677.1 hypothetical protein PR001_g9208 [Phytophthora rubi]KAE9342744.1 hypothetical protein PR003_g9311 [Phytophthora rubi]
MADSDAASRTFMGSTTRPPVVFTDDDAREYRSVADESFCETRALYEDFLYERKQSLDSRRWKHVRTKRAMKAYRQRSGVDSSFNSSVTSVSSTLSPDPLELDDDALLIGPASSLSVATKIPVVVCTGTVQGTLDDVIPTEADPFDFLGVAWILYAAPGLGAIVKQRDYVVLVRSGFATTSRGERIGYCIAQSVSHSGLPALKSLDVVRASMSFCVIFRQQSDRIVEAFAHAVVDPGGTILTFFVLQEIASSILGMGAPMECAQGKKLRWYVHKTIAEKEPSNIFDKAKSPPYSSSSATTEQAATARTIETEDRRTCAYCRKTIGKLFSTQSVQCTVCHECVCKRCSVNKELVVRSSHSKSGMAAHSYNFCLGCFLAARNLSTEEIQREEVVYKRFGSP